MKQFLLLLSIAMVFAACGNQQKQADTSEDQTREMTDADYVEQASFTAMDGATVDVDDFKGKVVMIDFWETWCKPCLASFPTMQKLVEEYPDDFAVVTVNPGFADTKEDAQKFISEHDYDFRWVLDSGNLNRKLGVQSIPFKVYVDAEGNFIKSSMGSYGPEKDYAELKSIIEKHKAASGGNENASI